MEFGEHVFLDPAEFTEQFGADLASGKWSVDEAVTQLAVMLSGLRCDADLIADDLTLLVEEAGGRLLEVGQPEFRRIIRLVTRGIIFREDFDDEPRLDKPSEVPKDLTIEKALANSIEGVIWIDPEAELWRDKMTTQDAVLLKAFIKGLERAGYPRSQAKDAMREEIESTLDYLAMRSSYAAARLLPILADVMFKAHLNNLRTGLNWVRRFRTMYKTFRG